MPFDQSAFPSEGYRGMTQRQWYAGQALISLAGAALKQPRDQAEIAGQIAKAAFIVADAMLIEETKG